MTVDPVPMDRNLFVDICKFAYGHDREFRVSVDPPAGEESMFQARVWMMNGGSEWLHFVRYGISERDSLVAVYREVLLDARREMSDMFRVIELFEKSLAEMTGG